MLQEKQIDLELLFNKNQLMDRLREEFRNCKEPDFVGYMEAHDFNVKLGIDALVQMFLHKRCDLPTLVGTLRHHCDTAQEVVDAVLWLVTEEFFMYDTTSEKFIVAYEVSQDVQTEIDTYQYPLPMIVPPKKVTSNKTSGYLTYNCSLILKKNHTNDDICLDHINRVNQVPLCINEEVSALIKLKWKNLDKKKPNESYTDFDKRKRAYHKYQKTAYEVMGIMIGHGNRFYITHRYDKRGRTYSQGYHCNYQGTPWNKAVIEFADKEIIP